MILMPDAVKLAEMQPDDRCSLLALLQMCKPARAGCVTAAAKRALSCKLPWIIPNLGRASGWFSQTRAPDFHQVLLVSRIVQSPSFIRWITASVAIFLTLVRRCHGVISSSAPGPWPICQAEKRRVRLVSTTQFPWPE
jgi:hypothetical protein